MRFSAKVIKEIISRIVGINSCHIKHSFVRINYMEINTLYKNK